jgi:hypothetical protein
MRLMVTDCYWTEQCKYVVVRRNFKSLLGHHLSICHWLRDSTLKMETASFSGTPSTRRETQNKVQRIHRRTLLVPVLVELYLHSPIRLHGLMLNCLSAGTTWPYCLFYQCRYLCFRLKCAHWLSAELNTCAVSGDLCQMQLCTDTHL